MVIDIEIKISLQAIVKELQKQTIIADKNYKLMQKVAKAQCDAYKKVSKEELW